MFVSPLFLIALFSEIVGTVAGFGSSVFFVPLAGCPLVVRSVLPYLKSLLAGTQHAGR